MGKGLPVDRVFVDTGAFIALENVSDEYHEVANSLPKTGLYL